MFLQFLRINLRQGELLHVEEANPASPSLDLLRSTCRSSAHTCTVHVDLVYDTHTCRSRDPVELLLPAGMVSTLVRIFDRYLSVGSDSFSTSGILLLICNT